MISASFRLPAGVHLAILIPMERRITAMLRMTAKTVDAHAIPVCTKPAVDPMQPIPTGPPHLNRSEARTIHV